MGSEANMIFREVQRPRQLWLWLIVLLASLGAWFTFAYQIVLGRPAGSDPAPDIIIWIMWLLIGLGLPAFFFAVYLQVEVKEDRIYIHYFPLLMREIAAGDIEQVYARTYRPVREYGGWGVRWGPRRGKAYNVSGSRGLQLELRDGKKLLIGSQRSDEFQEAVEKMLARSRVQATP